MPARPSFEQVVAAAATATQMHVRHSHTCYPKDPKGPSQAKGCTKKQQQAAAALAGAPEAASGAPACAPEAAPAAAPSGAGTAAQPSAPSAAPIRHCRLRMRAAHPRASAMVELLPADGDTLAQVPAPSNLIQQGRNVACS